MKLELKHLAPYLPYELMIRCDFKDGDVLSCKLESLNEFEAFLDGCDWDYSNNTDFKPILRPLSDLTKEIEHNGEIFVTALKLLELNGKPNRDLKRIKFDGSFIYEPNYSYGKTILGEENLDWFISEALYTKGVSLKNANFLFKYHFDVFGLIEKGLAIDINTL